MYLVLSMKLGLVYRDEYTEISDAQAKVREMRKLGWAVTVLPQRHET